jgi:hypothetical protein
LGIVAPVSLFKHGKDKGGAPSEPVYQGRHLHSAEDDETCLATLKTLMGAPEKSYFHPEWTGDENKAPTTLIGIKLSAVDPEAVFYFAIWTDGGYLEGPGYQEMAVIPPHFDVNAPMPMIGQWKAFDESLTSIGWTTGFAVR